MSKISILGCGWLGFPLAKAWTEKGFAVNGSTTSESKIPILKAAGITPFVIALGANETLGNVTGFMENAEILVIDIPPKLRSDQGENFSRKIKALIPFIENSGVSKVLFVSSTAVYADDNSVVTEHTVPNPETENGKQLLQVETLLQANIHFKTTVLRFGGLIGEDRHPVKYLAGKENLGNPEAPVNLIHRDDCIGIILKIIKTGNWGEIFNAASPLHPTRKDYYMQKAIGMNLPLPKFNDSPSFGKIIDPQKIIRELGYEFLKPEL